MPLEAVIGPMFAGKTSELIRRLERERIAGRKVVLFKSKSDSRYSEADVVAHDARKFVAYQIHDGDLDRVTQLSTKADVVAIDEIQFFPIGVVKIVEELMRAGKRVMFTGLNLNFRGEPFNDTIREILPRSDNVAYLTAVCTYRFESGKTCGAEATRTQRLVNGKPAPYDAPLVLIAGKESYEARCFRHHEVPKS